MRDTSESRRWWWLALATGGGVLVYLLAPILTPFLVSGLLAYLGSPVVERLAGPRLPRGAAVVLVFVALFLLVALVPVIVLPLLEREISVLVRRWPEYLDWVQSTLVPWLQARLGQMVSQPDLDEVKSALLARWQQAGGIAAQLMGAVSRSGLAMLGWLANLVLIPVVTFYLLRDWHRLTAGMERLLPQSVRSEAVALARECDEVLATFLRGQLSVMLSLGVFYSLGLWLTGLELAFLIGMLAGAVSFVPYLGVIVGLLAAGIAAAVQFQEIVPLIWVVVVFGLGQLLEGMVLTPLLVGDRIGLHPVAVIFAVMAGGQLFGFVGVLLALPVAAVVAVLLRYFHRRYVYGEGAEDA